MRTLVENTRDMNKRQLAILVTAAILLHSVCFCMAAVPTRPAASCESHRRQGGCPAHQHPHSRGDHACCQVGTCNSPSQVRAEASDGPSQLDSITFGARVPVAGIRRAAASSALIAKEHSPPSAVPVFLATKTL